jgi:murein L,D-transpeptidase YafK
MRVLLLAFIILVHSAAGAVEKADFVLVKKSERKLLLMRQGRAFKEFRIALGPKPRGPKIVKGDEHTPEGEYILDGKNEKSAFYKSIHISYPNAYDRERSRIVGRDPGGLIMIHGQPRQSKWPVEIAQSFNWTNGCLALTNDQMDVLWASVEVGTPIKILP